MRKTALLPVIFLCISILGCGGESPKTAEKPETPEPLKDKSSSALLVKSDVRGFADGRLVDELYDDLTKKEPELQSLESQLQGFYDGRADSVVAFKSYYAKSDNYYAAANSALQVIQDSVLRKRLDVLLEQSKNKLAKKTSRFSVLIDNVENEARLLNDYHQALKIVATIPVIENYQDKNMPAIAPVKKVSDEATRLRAKTQQLVKKYAGE